MRDFLQLQNFETEQPELIIYLEKYSKIFLKGEVHTKT